MPAVKKSKTTVSAASCRLSAAPARQRGIQAYGKISKPLQVKSVPGEKAVSREVSLNSVSGILHGKKRKAGPTEEVSNEQNECRNVPGPPLSTHRFVPIEKHTDSAATQTELLTSANYSTPRKKRILRQCEIETPTTGARSLLETLALPSSPAPSASSPIAKPQETPPSSPLSPESPFSSQSAGPDLPEELQDLINLHSSFLTVLSFHYAHNGSMTPADLRNLAPGIGRAWRKRKATTIDIRRISALEQDRATNGEQKVGPLELIDYGHGKVCIEVAASYHLFKAHRRPLNEEALNLSFVRNLERQWTSYKTTQSSTPSPATFISSLDLAPIKPCPSLPKIAPLLSKGQRRLEDLKAGAIRAQQTALKPTTANSILPPHPKGKQTGARSNDLFSRLKAKQLHQSTLPLPPSTELLARKSALQRLPEIAPIVDSLAVSSKKHCDDDASAEGAKSRVTHVSFTMPTVVQHLQMSLRNPIGKQEATRCLRLLAEVVPEWVGVKEVGKLVSVTVRGLGIGRDELGRRIAVFTERL